MSLKWWIRIAATAVVIIAAMAMTLAWRAEMRSRAEISVQLAATKQALAAADARQQDRDARLTQSLTEIAAEKRRINTPAQIVKDLPNQIALPVPITLKSVSNYKVEAGGSAVKGNGEKTAEQNHSEIGANSLSEGPAEIPLDDLKPLYDFTLDCKACRAKLVTIQGDLSDERLKEAALAKERDEAVRIARGGSVWQRIGRASKWMLIGAAAGAVAARAVR
jgi:hypothetical protein